MNDVVSEGKRTNLTLGRSTEHALVHIDCSVATKETQIDDIEALMSKLSLSKNRNDKRRLLAEYN